MCARVCSEGDTLTIYGQDGRPIIAWDMGDYDTDGDLPEGAEEAVHVFMKQGEQALRDYLKGVGAYVGSD